MVQLGGGCFGPIDVIIVIYGETIAACQAHRLDVKPLLDELVRRRKPRPLGCAHLHRSADARALCDRRLRRRAS